MIKKERQYCLARFLTLGIILSGLVTTLHAGQRNASNNDVTFYDSASVIFADNEQATGLVLLEGGFALSTNASSTFNVPVPISGPISLGADSILTLTGDMYWDSSVTLDIGTAYPGKCFIAGGGKTIHLGGDLTLPVDRGIRFINSDTTIDGNGNVVTFGSALTYLQVVAGSTLTLKNMILKGFRGNLQIQGGGTIVLQNVIADTNTYTWELSLDNPNVVIADNVLIRGNGAFAMRGTGDLTISANSLLTFDTGLTIYYEPSDNTRNHIVFTNGTSFLHFNDCLFNALGTGGSAGIQFLKGTVFVENKVLWDNGINTDPATSIEFGDGSGLGNDATLKVLGGATLEVNGYVYQNPA